MKKPLIEWYGVDLLILYPNGRQRKLSRRRLKIEFKKGKVKFKELKNAYTSPFICELYDRGRCQIRLGMIDSLSITRGTSNLGFNNNGNG